MKKHLLFIAVPVVLFILVFLFQSGNLILGGEGHYFLDTKTVKDLYGSAWFPLGSGTGTANPIIHQTFVVFDFISALQTLRMPNEIINLMTVFLIYFLPFASMFFLLFGQLRLSFKVSMLVSLFYILNPYSIIHFQFLMFWNIAPFVVFPLTFAIIHRFYSRPFYLFTFFGLFTLVAAFTFENIPYLALFHIFLPITVVLVDHLKESNFQIKRVLKNYSILLVSFLLFSLWWLLPLIRFQLQDLKYDSAYAINYVQTSLGQRTFLWRLFSFKSYISEIDRDFITTYFNNKVINILLFIPFGLLIYGYFSKRIKGSKIIIPTILLFGVLFLNKGTTDPFGNVYLFLLDRVPLFFIFKTPLEKFSLLTVFLYSLIIALILKSRGRFFYAIFIVYLIVCSIPFLTLRFIPDYPIHNGNVVSKQFVDKKAYQDFRSAISGDSYDTRLFSLPGSTNYQITMWTELNKFYRGLDPLLFSVNKPFIAAYWATKFDHLYANLSNSNIDKLLGIYNVRNIVINHDIHPSYGVKEKESAAQLEALFSQFMVREAFGPITVYKNPTYVPRIYSATSLITTVSGSKVIPSIVLDKNFSIRTAIVMRQAIPLEIDRKLRLLQNSAFKNTEPTIEFRSINPSKYIVRVHGAKQNFILVLAEEFHKGWRMYLPEISTEKPKMSDIVLYKKLPKEEHQATKAELEQMVQTAKLSTLSREGVMRFISTNRESSIQNENLSDSPVWLTLNPVETYPDSFHFSTNGYANAWLIDLAAICSSKIHCIKNADGSTDFEVVLGFWPEQLRLVGAVVTIVVTSISILTLIFFVVKKKIV